MAFSFFLRNKLSFVSFLVLAAQMAPSKVMAMDANPASATKEKSSLDTQKSKLFAEARAGDRRAQDAIMSKFFSNQLPYSNKDLIKNLINELDFFSWNNIIERCYENFDYSFFIIAILDSQDILTRFPDLPARLHAKIKEIEEKSYVGLQTTQDAGRQLMDEDKRRKRFYNSLYGCLLLKQRDIKGADYFDRSYFSTVDGSISRIDMPWEFDLHAEFSKLGKKEWLDFVQRPVSMTEEAFNALLKDAMQGNITRQDELIDKYYSLELTDNQRTRVRKEQNFLSWENIKGRCLSNPKTAFVVCRVVPVDSNEFWAELYLGVQRLAQKGDIEYQLIEGLMLSRGLGLNKKDLAEAIKCLTFAANHGYPRAQYLLGDIYLEAKDYENAIFWLEKAGNEGITRAQMLVAGRYMKGEGVAKDIDKALSWYTKAAEAGNKLAQYNVGIIYAQGKEVPLNTTLALKWLSKAAEQEEIDALFILGQVYVNGQLGVHKDLSSGIPLLEKSAAQGKA